VLEAENARILGCQTPWLTGIQGAPQQGPATVSPQFSIKAEFSLYLCWPVIKMVFCRSVHRLSLSPTDSDRGMAWAGNAGPRADSFLAFVSLLGSSAIDTILSVSVSLGQTPMDGWHWSPSSQALLRLRSILGMGDI